MTPPSAPAARRNRGPILEVLCDWLAHQGRVLEVASGTGEHAVFLARALSGLSWRPSERDAEGVRGLQARLAAEGTPNLLEPIVLDAAAPDTWPEGPFVAVVAINLIHIAPWAATEGLMAGAGRVLGRGGALYLYGPFREAGRAFAPSNQAFDESLRARDPAWGVRELRVVTALAEQQGLVRAGRVEMPANNLSVLFRKCESVPARPPVGDAPDRLATAVSVARQRLVEEGAGGED